MRGKDDFVKILALNEAAAITAGSSDEAGNNVFNLLAKLTSHDIETAARALITTVKELIFPARWFRRANMGLIR